MQDIHSLAGGGPQAERLFVAAAMTGDGRFLRPTNQALKCPRCDSLNTKFCYYNNYNLSQPRHFCKSCRRYWTKGGVLRNVPVGGGCRKSKQSSSTSSSSSSQSLSAKPRPSPSPSAVKSRAHDADADASAHSINHPSCGSSVIPAATAAAAAVAAPADIPTIFHELRGTSASSLYGVEEVAMDHQHHVGCGGEREEVGEGMMAEMGNFPSLMGSTTGEMGAAFDYAGMMMSQQEEEETGDMVDVEGFGALDWEGSGGESNGGDGGVGMFGVTRAVDHAYWSQQNQWSAADDVLYDQHRGGVDLDDDGLFLP